MLAGEEEVATAVYAGAGGRYLETFGNDGDGEGAERGPSTSKEHKAARMKKEAENEEERQLKM